MSDTEAAAARPNVIVIVTDDQGCWALGAVGNEEIRTPNLDRLAGEGIRFERFFCVSPVCSAARASLLTGTIPSRHGVHDWIRHGNSVGEKPDGRLIPYLEGQVAYTDLLAAAGYDCGLVGKWHLGDCHHAQCSLEFPYVHARGGGPYYGAPIITGPDSEGTEPRYITDAITDAGLAYIDDHAGLDSPFYLSVHYTAPHSPWERDQHPAELFSEYYEGCDFESVPDEPKAPSALPWTRFFDSPEDRREMLSGYYAAVTAMDAGVGRILDRLEALGIRQRTLILFTSDNGMNMGHHGICGKGNGTWPLNMFETSVRVPALISQPGSVPAGAVEAGLWSHYDVLPTLVEHLDLPEPDVEGLAGRSFAPLLRGERPDEPDEVVVFDEYGGTRMIRTERSKLVHRYPDGPDELYDLDRDPEERRNLLGEPGLTRLREDLLNQLDQWFERHADPAMDGAALPVTGRGQLDRVGAKGAFAKDWGI
jgi:arylsulfatase A-like enzyme